MTSWVDHVIWWHVYPLGFIGADHHPEAAHRLRRLEGWLDHLVSLGANGLLPSIGRVVGLDEVPDTIDKVRRCDGPPRIVVHGSQAAHVPESYKRYLANVFRERFDLFATPVSVEFRSDVNPFLKDKPVEKRGLKTSQKARRERRIQKDRAKRPAKKK